MAKVLTRCPVCEAALGISELACRRCQTRIHGAFDSCRFCSMEKEHLLFIELFLRSEGNLRRVEKELGLSYPTVRNRLTAALTALGLTGETSNSLQVEIPSEVIAPDSAARRRELLEALARGEVSAEEAALALRGLA